MLTVLRDTGNKALDRPEAEGLVAIFLDDSDAELAPFVLSSINQIVDELVTRPNRANDLYSLLPEGVRKMAERKREIHSGASAD